MSRFAQHWSWSLAFLLPCVLFQCETVTDGPALTIVSASAQSSSAGSGGSGAEGGGGSNTSSGSGGTTSAGGSTAASGGSGGSGGSPTMEKPVNGCLKSMATDMSGMTSISLSNPLTAPFCLIVSEGTTIDIDGTGATGGPLILGGELKAGNVKAYDNMSPIQPSCYNCNSFPACYDPNSASCYGASSWVFSIKKAYPFFDNSDAAGKHGAIYVVD